MKSENIKTNEPHVFRSTLAYKFNLKDPNKNNLLLIKHGKMLNLHIITIHLKQLQLGMVNLICLMDHILFLTYKIFLIISLKNILSTSV